MMFHKLSCLVKGQRGFTLIEVIVSLAILSLIGLGATVATGQVLEPVSYTHLTLPTN